MLQQQSEHVYALSSSPRRQSYPSPYPPRGILQTVGYPSPLPSPSLTPATPAFALATPYDKNEWTLINIVKAPIITTPKGTPQVSGSNLTVTLLYYPTMTLFAWPFNLSQPDSKGVCYETTWFDEETGTPRIAPTHAMSTSLRVLADVIRCWMKVRKAQSAAQRRASEDLSRRGSTGSDTSIELALNNDDVVDEIIKSLSLRQAAPLERAAHLVRQLLPSQQLTPSTTERRHSVTSSIDSFTSTDEDLHQQSRSASSSQASTAASSPEMLTRVLRPIAHKSPLPHGRLVTATPSTSAGFRIGAIPMKAQRPPPINIPAIQLHEATPVAIHYTERDQVLTHQPRAAVSRKSSYSNSMSTVEEVPLEHASEDETQTKVHPCDRLDAVPEPIAMLPEKEVTVVTTTSSPTRSMFRAPFKTLGRRTSK